MGTEKKKTITLGLCSKCNRIHSETATCSGCSAALQLIDHNFFLKKTFGKYLIREAIGAGAMGIVFKAVHKTLNKDVAVKIIIPSDEESTFEKRFLREARILAGLKHPNIIEVYDFDISRWGTPYYVMEYLSGKSLRQEIAKYPNGLPRDSVVDYLKQLLPALDTAHENGIVHRDLKPDNIFIEYMKNRKVLKLLDFGIAKTIFGSGADTGQLTATRCVLGTPYYLAPEQIVNKNIGPHTDQYALGLIIAEMLSGKISRANKTVGEIIYTEARKPIDTGELINNKRIPKSVIDALVVATAPNPRNRFPDLTTFVNKVLTALNAAPVAAPPKQVRTDAASTIVSAKPGLETTGAGAHTTLLKTSAGLLPGQKFLSIEQEVALENKKNKLKKLMLFGIPALLIIIIALVLWLFVFK
ncbi:MAG: serine/threonine protein kinase [bacterium]|nr:serine/threonine protein kinase [bacterium]